MLQDNLIRLRKLHKLTQEALAEKVGVSRQAVAKWENGESVPDLERSRLIAEVFDVSLDELVSFEPVDGAMPVPPKGKYIFGVVKVGEKGQIVIPARARRIFHIKPGDDLVVLGDEDRGLALLPQEDLLSLMNAIEQSK